MLSQRQSAATIVLNLLGSRTGRQILHSVLEAFKFLVDGWQLEVQWHGLKFRTSIPMLQQPVGDLLCAEVVQQFIRLRAPLLCSLPY